jgi:hypothetical protein
LHAFGLAPRVVGRAHSTHIRTNRVTNKGLKAKKRRQIVLDELSLTLIRDSEWWAVPTN